nr:ADP-ribosyltransferase [uncultured Tyzzerella sp.]
MFEEKAFMSTSLLKSQSFNNKDLILKINVPKGANGAFIRDLSEFPEEYELLFSPGQNLLVKSIRNIPNNKKIVEVDLVLKK